MSKARKELAAMAQHARTVRPVMPATTPLVRPLGHASDSGNARKDSGR